MKCRQVRKAIDERLPGAADRDQRLAILAHCEVCAECRGVLEAAEMMGRLIQARSLQEIEPSPFFRTRVLAAIRDRGAVAVRRQSERMWSSARAVVASMFVVVVVLLALNLFAPKPVQQIAGGETPRGRDSVERVVMDENSAADESLTSGQVLDTVFAQGDSYGVD
jgi:predicted anti-sigma-YlaC factor YlaD